MAYRTDPRFAQAGVAVGATDEGLRSFMLSVYNYMGLGLAITGVVALVVASSPAIYVPIFTSPLKWVVMLAPLGFVFFLSARIQTMSVSAAQITFWLFAAVMGLSMASIFLVFTGREHRPGVLRHGRHLRRRRASTATPPSATSTSVGSFLFMGLIGIIIASVVNIFIGSSALQFAGQRDRRAGVHRPDRLGHASGSRSSTGQLPVRRRRWRPRVRSWARSAST